MERRLEVPQMAQAFQPQAWQQFSSGTTLQPQILYHQHGTTSHTHANVVQR